MSKVKILHVMWNMVVGGAERAVYQLIRAQRSDGHQSSVLICTDLGMYGNKLKESGVDVHVLGMRHALDFSASRRFRETLRAFDIVHFHSCEPYVMYLAARMKGPRLFYTHRGAILKYPAKQTLRYKLCGHLIRRHFDGVSGNTHSGAMAAARLFALPPERVATTYNGLDFSLLEPKRNADHVLAELNLSKSKLFIGTSANFKESKRIDELIRALAQLQRDRFTCLLIGDGPERSRLEELTKQLNLESNIVFCGMKSHIGDYLQILDIFVLPAFLESFGNSAVEAMAMGLPTIVMEDGGGTVEHIVDGRTGFIAKDFRDLAHKLEQLADNVDLRRFMGEAGRRSVTEKYTTSRMLESYRELYGEVSA